ncbi:hypothetical protein [Spirillospora sp. CA-294931]
MSVAGDRRHVLYLRDGRYMLLDTRTGTRTPTRLKEELMTIFYW